MPVLWPAEASWATTVRRSNWSYLIGCIRRWFFRRRGVTAQVPYDVETARLLLSRGAAHDLPAAAALGDLHRVTSILDADPTRIREARPNGRLALSVR